MVMFQSPKSLTAVVHVRFQYEEPTSKSPSESEVEILSRLMDQASELEPSLQEILVQFAEHLKKAGKRAEQ